MKRQSGYTLIEVVVAFAMLALALSVLLAALSRATAQIRQSELTAKATLLAQSLLAQQGTSSRIRLQQQSGTLNQGQFQWTLMTQPYHGPDGLAQPMSNQSMPLLVEFIVTVSWGKEARQQLTWHTLRYVQQTALERSS